MGLNFSFEEYEYEYEIIYRVSESDTGKEFFALKEAFEKIIDNKISVKMGGVMDEFYSSFFWNNIRLKLEYCNWTGTELKVSNSISEPEKNQVEKLVRELIQELKGDIS